MIEDMIIMLIIGTIILVPAGIGGIILFIIDKIENFKERKEIEKLIKESNRDRIMRYAVNDYYL